MSVALVLLLAMSVATGCSFGSHTPAATADVGSGAGTAAGTDGASSAPSSEASESSSRTQYPLTITDDAGSSLTFAAAPTRIASFVPGATEMLLALGAKSDIAVVDKYSAPQFPELAELPTMDSYNVDFEALVALQPDLVITIPGPYLDQMHNLGLRVYILQPNDAAGVTSDLQRLGQVVDRQADAVRVSAQVSSQMKSVAAALNDVPTSGRVNVFYEIAVNPIFSAGQGSYADYLISAAGGVNIFGDQATAYPQVTAEDVVARAPDVIIGTTSDASLVALKQGTPRAGWENVPAVKNGRIYLYDDALLSQADTKVATAIQTLAHDFYPDAVPSASSANGDSGGKGDVSGSGGRDGESEAGSSR